MKIVAFAGSSSKKSINKHLVVYTSKQFKNAQIEILDLNDYEVPIFSTDKELDSGIPEKILELASIIDRSDLLLITLAEHNASYSTAFKNVYDWLSRIPNRTVFNETALFLMATSPGSRGGASVLAAAKERFPRDGGNIVSTFSLPNFDENFDLTKGKITNVLYHKELEEKINKITKDLS